MRYELKQGSRFPVELKQFDSVADLAEYSRGADLEWRRAMGCDGSRNTLDRMVARESFVGRQFANYAEAEAAANGTWSEGLATLERTIDQLRNAQLPAPVDRRRRARFNEYDGDEICVDRLRRGQPFWRQIARQNATGPTTLNILVDLNTPGFKASSDVFWRGAAAIALAELCEAAGYRVELTSYIFGAFYRSSGGLISCCLKRTSDPLDRASLVNATSGWFYRTVGFAAMVRSCEGKVACSGLGSIWRLRDIAGATNWLKPAGEPVVVIDDVWSQAEAVELIRRQIALLAEKSAA